MTTTDDRPSRVYLSIFAASTLLAFGCAPSAAGDHGSERVGTAEQAVITNMTATPSTCYARTPYDTCAVHVAWLGQEAGLPYNQLWYSGSNSMVACRRDSLGETVQVDPGAQRTLSLHPSSSCNPANKGALKGSVTVNPQVAYPLWIAPEICTIPAGQHTCTVEAQWSYSPQPCLWTKETQSVVACQETPPQLPWVGTWGTPLQLRDASNRLMEERFLIGLHPDPTISAAKIKVTPAVCEIPSGKTTCSARFQWSASAPSCLYAKNGSTLTAVSCNQKDDLVIATVSATGQTYELRNGTATAPGAFIDSVYAVGVPGQAVPAGDLKITLPVIGRRTESGYAGLNPGAGAISWDGRLIFKPEHIPLDDAGFGGYAWVVRVFRPEAKNSGVPTDVDLSPTANTLSAPWVLDSDPFPMPSSSAYNSWGNKAVLGANNFQLSGRLHISVSPNPHDANALAHGNPYRSNSGGAPNPAGAYETYKLLIIAPKSGTDQLYEMRATIIVASPQTATARVQSSSVNQVATLLTAAGQPIRAIEPSATLDGRLLVFNANLEPANATGYAMYSYNSDPNRAVSGWSTPRYMSQLYFDRGPGCCASPGEPTLPLLDNKKFSDVYPVARYPFRAPDGKVFDRDDGVPGAYPWITPDGTDLIFTTVPLFNGPSRAGTVLAGAHTEGKLVNIDTSFNAMRGNVGDAYNIFHTGPTAPTYNALLNAYDTMQVAGAPLGAGALQKTLIPAIAQYGSPWVPQRRNRPAVLPSNPWHESLGVYVVESGRYVEAPLPNPEHDLLVHLPMNEMLNFNATLLDWANNTSPPNIVLGLTAGSSATFDTLRTPDLSGNFNTGRLLFNAKFPFERKNAKSSAAGCFTNPPGTCTILDSIDGAVGNSIHLPVWQSEIDFPLSPRQKYLQINERGEFSASLFFKVISPASYMSLIWLPFLSYVSLEGDFVRVRIAGPDNTSATEQEAMVLVPGLSDGQWHHVAVTYVGRQLTTYIDGVIKDQRSLTLKPLTNPIPHNGITMTGQVGPSNGGEFQVDELYVYTRALSPAEVKRHAWIRSDPGTPVASLPALGVPANTYDGLKAQTGEYSLPVAQLGAKLFSDPILSYNGTKSCASCHKPEFAFGDNTPLSAGVNNLSTRRNVPSIVNRVFSMAQLADGRAESLETQVLHPILTRGELGHEETATQLDDLQTLINRLNQASSGYPARFQTAFGGPPTLARVSRALAHYVRSIIAQPSTFDTVTLTAQQAFGWRIFSGKGLCTSCHSGPNFTDEKFHDIGVFQLNTAPDDGRYVATGSLDDLYEFRTPSLRNVTKTAPYFHDGSRPTLESVVDFYNDGGAELKRRGKSVHIRPLRLTSTEKAALVAFLQTLESLPTASAPSGIASATPVP